MKTLLIAIFIFCASINSSAQALNFEKQKDISVSFWRRDAKMSRIFWPMNNVKTELAIACIGNNLTWFIIKQKGVTPITQKVDHPELAEGGYLIMRFQNELKRVNVYYGTKEPFGFTVEIILK